MRNKNRIESGMVVVCKDGVKGLTTDTALGMLIGFNNGYVVNLGENPKYSDLPDHVDKVFEITEPEQILGRNLGNDKMGAVVWDRKKKEESWVKKHFGKFVG